LKEIRNGETEAERAIDLVLEKEREFPKGALRLRFLENHDEQRAAKVFGVPGFEPYATFIFTLRGIPMLYAGQEVADTVKPSLFDKVEVNWGDADYSVRDFYKKLIRLRRGHIVFVEGETVKIPTDRPSEIVAYARRTDDHMAVVALNFSDEEITSTLRFPEELRSGQNTVNFTQEKEKPVQLFAQPMYQTTFQPFESKVYLSE
jgi:glycosidase